MSPPLKRRELKQKNKRLSMSKKTFFAVFNPPRDIRLACPEASLTQQEFADECDLNKIMERYAAGMGTLPIRPGNPIFGDFSDLPDYATALDVVSKANEAFGALPAKLRDRFDNDPAALLAFLADSKNKDAAIELGLIDKPAPAPAQEAHMQNGGNDDAAGK